MEDLVESEWRRIWNDEIGFWLIQKQSIDWTQNGFTGSLVRTNNNSVSPTSFIFTLNAFMDTISSEIS